MRTTEIMKGLLLALLLAFAACGQEAEDRADEAAPPEGRGDMGDMGGMEGTMESTGMMSDMRSHLAMMEAAGGDEMVSMVPQHRQMLGNMMSQMNREMAEMDMRGDRAWDATADSLRQDLTRIPEMAAPDLEAMMDAHAERIRRMMEMHEEMMRAMRPR